MTEHRMIQRRKTNCRKFHAQSLLNKFDVFDIEITNLFLSTKRIITIKPINVV